MPESDEAAARAQAVSAQIDRYLHFHRRWRRSAMSAYVVITITIVTASTLATIISAFHCDLWASISAGIATIVIGADKSLMFKEKWRLHVGIVSRLETLKLALDAGELSVADAVRDIGAAIEMYADELPFPLRD